MAKPRRPSARGGDSLTPGHAPGSSPAKRPGGRWRAGLGLQGRGRGHVPACTGRPRTACPGLRAELSWGSGGLTLAGGLLKGHWGPALPPPRVHAGRVLPGSLRPQLSLVGAWAGEGARYAEGGGLGRTAVSSPRSWGPEVSLRCLGTGQDVLGTEAAWGKWPGCFASCPGHSVPPAPHRVPAPAGWCPEGEGHRAAALAAPRSKFGACTSG